MFELQVLAFRSEVARISTLMSPVLDHSRRE
jgi:hypothetical protein